MGIPTRYRGSEEFSAECEGSACRASSRSVTARIIAVVMHHTDEKRAEDATLLDEALLLWKQRWGRRDLDVATSLSNLAEIHRAQGNLYLATPLFFAH